MATAETPLLSDNNKPRSNWRRHVAIVILLLAVGGLAAGLVLRHAAENNPPKTDPTVHLCGTVGEVTGIWEGDVAVFRGLPFGAAARWQVPLPTNSCWATPFEAKTDGFVCPQFGLSSYVVEPPTKEDEDCLHLNVMSKNIGKTSSLLPVVFFIHGGSNVVGWPSWYSHIDSFAQNDFCVVAPSYRLGTLGFLALPELAARDLRKANVSGNYAIEDLRLALRWTQTHARDFGCDPSSVTIMGQSSGGTNVLALLANANNSGLFHRAISLTGSPNLSANKQQAEAQGKEFLSQTGCDKLPDMLNCILNLPVKDVVEATPGQWAVTNVLPASPAGTVNAALPHVDGFTVQTSAAEALAAGLVDVPLLMQDGLTDVVVLLDPSLRNVSVPAYQEFILSQFQPWGDDNATGQHILDAYREVASFSVWEALAEFTSDMSLFCANVVLGQTIRAEAARKAPFFVSLVAQPAANPAGFPSHTPQHNYNSMTFDGWDYMAATGHWGWFAKLEGGNDSYTPKAPDHALGATLRSNWFSFARTGKPVDMLPFFAPSSSSTSDEDFMVNLVGDAENFNSKVTNLPNARAFFCSVLAEHNLTDMRFWLVN